MKIEEFINKWEGKTIDYDGFYGFQCTDFVRQYCFEMFGETYKPSGNAGTLFTQYWGNDYIKYENTPSFIPNEGDIVIFEGPTQYGHIGVVIKGDAHTMIIIDQNTGSGNGDGTGKNKIRTHSYNYGGVIGFVRNKKYSPSKESNSNRYSDILNGMIEDGYEPVFNVILGDNTLNEAEIKTLIEIGLYRTEKKLKEKLKYLIK